LQVADTGIGIAPEDKERIFERFYRSDKSHTTIVPGNGLGLSIVKHGVQLHHGTIDVESVVNQGTTMTIKF
jgi:signal transduction histidine kinase